MDGAAGPMPASSPSRRGSVRRATEPPAAEAGDVGRPPRPGGPRRRPPPVTDHGGHVHTAGGRPILDAAAVSTADTWPTAAPCVYWKGFATNIAYVPGYHDGKRPYGAWAVRAITVANGWKVSHNPDLDFAFLTLASAGGRQIQARTGGLTIGFTRWYSEQKIEVIGHNDSGAKPIRCATKSFRFRAGQMEFYCHGFWTGTSGGPWIIGYNAKNGTGTVFGVIGGYELGGDYEWASYSAYFGSATRTLYQQAERADAAPHPYTDSPAAQTPRSVHTVRTPVADRYGQHRLPGSGRRRLKPPLGRLSRASYQSDHASRFHLHYQFWMPMKFAT